MFLEVPEWGTGRRISQRLCNRNDPLIITAKLSNVHGCGERMWGKGDTVSLQSSKGSNGFSSLSLELSQRGNMLAVFTFSPLQGTDILITQRDTTDSLGLMAIDARITHLNLLILIPCSTNHLMHSLLITRVPTLVIMNFTIYLIAMLFIVN